LKEKKVSELESYEKEYLDRLKGKKKPTDTKPKKSVVKKTKKKVPKKPTDTKPKKSRKSSKKKTSNYNDDDDGTGIVLIEDDLEVDEQMQLEERKAYLEEARSQESSD